MNYCTNTVYSTLLSNFVFQQDILVLADWCNTLTKTGVFLTVYQLIPIYN